MYPLTPFTLEQMLNDVRLQVKDESKMSLELLRLVRIQLNEGLQRSIHTKGSTGEDGPEWVARRKFEDEVANFMLEKKFHAKETGEILDQHHKEMHERFSQILFTIRKRKILKPEASNFAITTRSGVSTQDPLFPTLLQSTPTDHAKGATEKEGPKGAESIIMRDEEAPLSTILYQPSRSSNLPFPSRVKKQKKNEDEQLLSIFKQIHINLPDVPSCGC
nr:hypothetical protein [Tanacetum cinerariifolium]